MNRYDIVAKGTYLDTNEDVNISINYQLEDILDVSSRATNWTRSFTLPGTPTNNLFFKHMFDVNIDAGTFNPLKKIPTRILVGDNQQLSGSMRLESISDIQGLVEYKVSIYGVLGNVMADIKDLQMQDLDVSEWNHVRNRENIINSYTYKVVKNGSQVQYEGPGNGYVYPFIVYGGDIQWSNNLNIYDTFPALYATPLFKKIITNQGYEISSEFLDSDYANKLIIPFTGNKLQLDETQIDNFGSVVGIPSGMIEATSVLNRGGSWQYVGNLPGWTRESGTVDDVSGELTFKDNLNQFTPGTGPNIGPGGFWVAQNQGYYDIDFRATVYAKYTHEDVQNINYDEGSGDFEYIYDMWVIRAATGQHQQLTNSGGTQLFKPSSGDHLSPWIDTGIPLDLSMACSGVLLDVGDAVYVRYGFRYPSSVHWSDELQDDKIHAQLLFDSQKGNEFSKFSITPSSNTDMGNQMVNMQQVLPENWKQTDFVGDFIKSFNLIVTEDKENPNLIIIESRDKYYSTNNKILEWEPIWDEKSGVEITPMSQVDSGIYEFTHTEDSDFYNQEYLNAYNRNYASFKIDVGNDFSDKTNTTKLSIAATPNAIKLAGKVAPYFLVKDDEGFKPYKSKPRMLFYGGLLPTEQLILQDYPGAGAADRTVLDVYPYCGMWDHPTEPEHDLGWGPTETIYWFSTQFPVKNLFNEFHRNTLNNIINPNARLLEAKFKLAPRDIAQFDFRNVVFFLGAYWRVNQIKNYDPSAYDKLTTVQMYKLLDAYSYDKVTAVVPLSNYVCPIDMVTRKVNGKLLHVSKSGLPVSESCCSSMGGDYIDGVCYVGDYSPGTVGSVSSTASANLAPAPSPEGPISQYQNGNALNAAGVKVHGHNNIVNQGTPPTVMLIGNNNTAMPSAKNTIVIGDNQVADQENVINLNGTIISQSGSITPNFNMLRGPKDEVRPLFPYNPYWNMVRGPRDAVRNVDFISEANIFRGPRDSV